MNDSKNTVEYRATLDASGVKAGAQEAAKAIAAIHGQPVADSLKDVAGEATRMGAAVKAASGQASDGLERVAKTSQETKDGQAQANQAAQQFLATLREQISVAGKSSEELLRYRAAQAGVAAEAAPLILQWQNQKAAQLAAAEAAQQEAAAQREASIVKQRAAAAQDAFLAGLRDQAALQGKTSSEVLQYRAAQLGVSESAAQYIKALDDANNANKRGTISAGQHAQAMRMLPMQMTDVVTSVASGMPIWMVAIQQGGQIKDSFGGIGNAARAVVGTITPVTAAIGALVGVGGLMAAAYYQGSAEQDKFRQVTVLNGNAAGVTAEALSRMSREVDGIYGTQSKAAEGLAILAGSGKIARDSLVEFTAMAVRMEDLGGRSIEQTAKELEQLGTKPSEASAKLNEAYNYLTPAVYRQIRALEDQGKAEDAAALAQKTYSDAMSARAKQLEGELGYIERGWRGARDLAKEAWDAFLNIGRPTTVQDQAQSHIKELEEAIRRRKEQNANLGIKDGKATAEMEAQLENAKGLLQLSESAGKASAEAIDKENKRRQDGIDLQREAVRLASDATKKQIELDQAKAKYEPLTRVPDGATKEEIKEAAKAAKDYATVIAGIEEKFSKKGGKGAGGIRVSDTEMASMRSQLAAAQQYHQQLLTMGSSATELNTAERESLKIGEQIKLATDGKTIARLKEKQAIADTLAAQLRSNEGLEQSYKAHQQAIDANYKDAQSIGQRARDQAAANEVFGKGRTAIQQMTLATLQHQLAEAEGSDSFDPKYIASLREKIAAQKDMVAALGQADYKTAKQHADELLRSANELAESYEVEHKFSGLSAAERQRIAAMRQVELKYAKEIAAVDKLNLGDAEKKAVMATVEQARLQELAAASNKVMLQQWSESVQQYDDVFRKGFADMLNRGEGNWKSFTTSLATTFKTTVADTIYKTFAQPFVVRMVGQLLGVSGGGAMATAANAGGLGSNAGGVNSILNGGMNGSLMDWSTWGSKGSSWLMGQGMDLVTKGWETAGSSLMSLGQTVQGVDTWLKGVPGMSGGIGSAAGYLGSLVALSKGQYGTAIGSAIGTAIMPGIGTMVGGFLGGLANGIFGGSVEQTGNGIAGRLGGTLRSYADFEKDGGWFGSDRSWTQYAALAANSQLQATFEVLQTGIGDQAKALGQSSDAVKKYTREIRFSTQGLSGDQVAARLQEEMTAAGNAMAALVLGTDKYTLAGETASATLQRMSTSLTVTNTSLDAMGGKLFEVGLAGANMASKLVANFGSVDAYIAASEAYYKTYYSQAERANNSTAAMTRQLAELGLTLPGTQTEFRALVSSLDLTTEHGRKAYATLLAMAPQFDETAKMLDELAKAAAADLIATYTRAAAVAPGMQIARDAMSGTTSQAQTLGGSMSSINKILGDSASGVLTWSNQVQSSTSALNPAQLAVSTLRAEILGLQASASGTVLNIDGLSKALQGVDTRTWAATISSAFELIAKRVRDDLSSIATERSAVREAAISIIGPTVMTPAQIRAQITRQAVALPGQTGIANAQSALAKADALVKTRETALSTAVANNANKSPGLLNSAAALEAKRGNEARDLVATYLRYGKVQDGIRGEWVPDSLRGLVTYEDTQANMLAKLKNLPTAEIQAFADQLASLGRSGLSDSYGSTAKYLQQLSEYQAAVQAEAANQAKAQSLRAQAADLAAKVTSAEQALATARASQATATGNAQKAQLDYVAALQKYSLDSGKAVSNLSKLREETVAYYQSQAQLAQTMGASASSLRQTVADIRFSQMDTGSQFANLQERYNVAYSMAMATQGEALAGYGNEMNSLLNPLLSKAQEAGLGGAEYAALVKTLLARAEAIAGRIEKDAPKNYQEESLGLLGQIDSTLAALEAGAKSSDQVMTEAIKAGTDTTRDGLRAVIAALQGRPVPAFALGGDHVGGWRLVGERGPELEATGPARYFTADQTQRMLSGPPALAGFDIAPLLRELQELRRIVEVLSADRRADGGAIATNTGRIHRLLDRLMEDDIKHITGLSESLLLQITQLIQDGLQVRNKSGEQFVVTQEAV